MSQTVPTSARGQGNTALASLPDIPLNKKHIWIYIVGALGYFFDAFDILLPSYVIPLISQQWRISVRKLRRLDRKEKGVYGYGAAVLCVLAALCRGA